MIDEIEVEDVEQIKDDLEGTNITDDYTLAQNTNVFLSQVLMKFLTMLLVILLM